MEKIKRLKKYLIAEKIDAYAKKHNAALRISDLAEHQADWPGTISKNFHGVSLHEIPPNGKVSLR